MGYIYLIRNIKNGKAYIGQTTQNPTNRLAQHLRGSGSKLIRHAVEKHGRSSFTLEILHEALDFLLDDLEAEEIRNRNTLAPNGYNIEGGGNANKNCT